MYKITYVNVSLLRATCWVLLTRIAAENALKNRRCAHCGDVFGSLPLNPTETREGEFVRVNPTLIQGAGTTSKAHHYEWRDVTAQPHVVYYYRLEDVSFSGEPRELGTVRLRGHISARGKRTTVWGDVKSEE